MEIVSRNTNTLATELYPKLKELCIRQKSRNGDVLRMPRHTTITLTHPWERVNFCQVRDANPFFHLIESACMLADYNDVKLLSYFAKNMASFSDDGETFNAFYGSRLGDQLKEVCFNLLDDPTSRREVALIWDQDDLTKETKDKACNLCLVFMINQETGRLDMSSFNRSNDMVWGFVTGANVVHFSYFHEFVACSLNMGMGEWTHTSCNMHAYVNEQLENVIEAEEKRVDCLETGNLYPSLNFEYDGRLFPDGSIAIGDAFKLELGRACAEMSLQKSGGCIDDINYKFEWISDLIIPVFNSWHFNKLSLVTKGAERETLQAMSRGYVNKISPLFIDWRFACEAWLKRRHNKK